FTYFMSRRMTIQIEQERMQKEKMSDQVVDAMTSNGGFINISTPASDDQITLTVADNAVGIAEANLSRIFDPFYTTKPVGQGTGLGLSICYGIVKKLGGDMLVQRAKGRGTTFNIIFPITKDPYMGQETDHQ
ncbi:MAG: hypothetical protein KFF68_18075, partial [Desulfosarcina sp.]|nr:hypothetical protein [Desulfosarcina sp.]